MLKYAIIVLISGILSAAVYYMETARHHREAIALERRQIAELRMDLVRLQRSFDALSFDRGNIDRQHIMCDSLAADQCFKALWRHLNPRQVP